MGCPAGQGNFLSKPLHPEAAVHFAHIGSAPQPAPAAARKSAGDRDAA
jgi:EAL domain-containing protein (putative c-di-GMP-specific phosphodiesterase class I)